MRNMFLALALPIWFAAITLLLEPGEACGQAVSIVAGVSVETAAIDTGSLVAEHIDPRNVLDSYGCGHFQMSFRVQRRLRMPGEFEQQKYIVLALDSMDADAARTTAQMTKVLSPYITVVLLYNDHLELQITRNLLEKKGCDLNNVRFVMAQHETRWIRDFGPMTLDNGKRSSWIDWYYNENRPLDDRVFLSLADWSGMKINAVDLELEGGNLLSNGAGLILTTTRVMEGNADNYPEHQIAEALLRTLAATDLVVLEPLDGEPTEHVDMFATFVSANTVLVGAYDAEVDPVNSRILDRNAARLSRVMTTSGPLKVVRIPMGHNDDDIWRTYTNCIYSNGQVVVPHYDDANEEIFREVIRIYEDQMPGWRVVSLDASEIIRSGGAFRCASLNVFKTNRDIEDGIISEPDPNADIEALDGGPNGERLNSFQTPGPDGMFFQSIK